MKVILAKPRGFCAGVVRAIEIVERAIDKYGPPVYVRHEIVHNKWVVDALKARGARFVENLSEVPTGAITIFSAHGVAKKVEKEATEAGLRVLNATCPLVSKVHAQGRHYVRNGRTLVLIGHAGHPEVEGTLGQIPGPVTLVQTEADVDALDLPNDTPIAYVTQTTLSIDDTRGIIAALFRRFKDVVGPGTQDICYATQNRQTALLELTKIVDVIFVVGAKNSSNSNRLREIGLEAGIPTHLIANGGEIDPEWLQGAEVVGITAGASAPEIMVRDVINALRKVTPVEVFTLPGQDEHIEFRVPVELLDVTSANNISKDGKIGNPSSAEAVCR
jgi:4-hydroxy-3-methylbut-2-enyl diphosphate reductase